MHAIYGFSELRTFLTYGHPSVPCCPDKGGLTVYRFPHTTYPYSSCICSFLQQHPYFLFILFVLVPVIFCNVSNSFFAQYKHTYGQLRASHGSHMKAAHTVLYVKKHTQTYASYPAMDISCMSVVSISK